MFRNLDELVQTALSKGPVQIAVAAGHDPDVIEAMKQAKELKLAEGIFVGNSEKILALAQKAGLDIPAERMIHEVDESMAARKAIALVREGKARLLMKGKIKHGSTHSSRVRQRRWPSHWEASQSGDRLSSSRLQSVDDHDRRGHQHCTHIGT